MKGLYIVISGPSGAGKTALIQALRARMPDLKKSVSVTTRPPRPNEEEGVHYYFKTLRQYQQMIADGEFLETAEVYTNFYGTPKKPLFEELDKGNDVIGELDTLGARQVKASYPESVRVYIMPSGFQELERRLKKRGSESAESLKRRVSSAHKELARYNTYDYIVFNDKLEDAVQRLIEIIHAEKSSMARNKDVIDKYLKGI
jgi:guanylate kinase